MSGYALTRTQDPGNPHDICDVEIRLHTDATWPDLVGAFVKFLVACGYSFTAEALAEEAGDAATETLPHPPKETQ